MRSYSSQKNILPGHPRHAKVVGMEQKYNTAQCERLEMMEGYTNFVMFKGSTSRQ